MHAFTMQVDVIAIQLCISFQFNLISVLNITPHITHYITVVLFVSSRPHTQVWFSVSMFFCKK